MLRRWRFQFGLRTLLVAMVIFGVTPWVAVQVIEWREDQLWNKLDKAKSLRNQALDDWRREYDIFIQGNVSIDAESHARERYYNMRSVVESSTREVSAYYVGDQARLEAKVAQREKTHPNIRPLKRE